MESIDLSRGGFCGRFKASRSEGRYKARWWGGTQKPWACLEHAPVRRCILAADVNECVEGNGGCAQRCMNEAGGFRCLCERGWELNADGRSCDGESRGEGRVGQVDQDLQTAG